MTMTESSVLDRMRFWASQHSLIRALLLTSSRASPHAPLDRLSDYDVVVIVTDLQPFVRDEDWLRWYGAPLVMFHDNYVRDGSKGVVRLVLYDDGSKIDYTVSPTDYLARMRGAPQLDEQLDIGYQVLVDKDRLTDGLPSPPHTAHLPHTPTESEFLALVNEFWWETTYVAKNLWRDELFPAKYSFDAVIKFGLLRRLLEWCIELDHGWSLRPGSKGRYLEQRLPPALWTEVERTFVGADIEENWEALFRTCALFRTIASLVAARLGYTYPEDLDQGVRQYLLRLKEEGSGA